MKKSLIAILLIFSCSSETVEDPINTVDPTAPTDPVVTVEYGLQEFEVEFQGITRSYNIFCLLYTSPSPRD